MVLVFEEHFFSILKDVFDYNNRVQWTPLARQSSKAQLLEKTELPCLG